MFPNLGKVPWGFSAGVFQQHTVRNLVVNYTLTIFFSRLLEKMVSNVFTSQPRYRDDLRASLRTTGSAMETTADRVDAITQISNCESRHQIGELADVVRKPAETVNMLRLPSSTYVQRGHTDLSRSRT